MSQRKASADPPEVARTCASEHAPRLVFWHLEKAGGEYVISELRRALGGTDAFDVVAFAEVSEEFLSDLQAAEGAAYGANFADFSTSVGKGGLSPAATQLVKCREDVRRLKKRSGEMVALLGPLRK